MTTTATSTQPDAATSAVMTGRSDTLAYANLALIALIALVVVIAIIVGVRLRARRKAAERETKRRIEAETIPLTDKAVAPPGPAPASFELPSTIAIPAIALPPQPDPSLTTLKGLGPKAAARLAELGVPDVATLAALTPAQADIVDGDLGAFQGRLARDRWVEQAQLLVRGDVAAYEALFGKLGA